MPVMPTKAAIAVLSPAATFAFVLKERRPCANDS